jgi:hypothetical protein
MKQFLKIFTTLICFALLATTATARAVDKNLPTKEEVTTFANNVTFKYDFALVASAHSKEEHPAWK